jgi:hypothetical protein
MNKNIENLVKKGMNVKLVQPGLKKKRSIKTWQAFLFVVILYELNAVAFTIFDAFPYEAVNKGLLWLAGLYFTKRVAQKHPKFGGVCNDNNNQDS